MALAFSPADRSTYDVWLDDQHIGQVRREASTTVTGRWAAYTREEHKLGDDFLTRRAAAEALEAHVDGGR